MLAKSSIRAQAVAIAGLCSVLAMTFATSPARAQAPPPIGHWATSPPTEELYVFQNGSCGFFWKGRVKYSGRCTWNPSYRGGILTLTYPMPLAPGHIRYNCVYINSTTMSVFGDIFHKKG